MRVLICGGGVIGVAIAYYLSLRGAEAVVIERTGIANAASGKSGGFLALDWCDGSRLSALARRSFALHAELAEVVPDGGYRRLTTYGGFSGRGGRREAGDRGSRTASPSTAGSARPETTAQIDPAGFTKRPDARGREHTAQSCAPGTVTGLLRDGDRVTGVVVDGEPLEGDAVVIAMGPWSILAAAWLPLPAVHGLKGHSVVYDTGDAVPPEALFLEVGEAGGGVGVARGLPAAERHHLCLRHLQRKPAAGRPGGGGARPGRHRPAHGDRRPGSRRSSTAAKVIAAQACFRPVTGRRPAADRRHPRRRRRLCRDRPQRLGHAQRTGDRRGDGRADPRRPSPATSILRPSIPGGSGRSMRRGLATRMRLRSRGSTSRW